MVDSQFRDDQYVDNDERNQRALEEARRRTDAAVMAQPVKKAPSVILTSRAEAMKAAALKASQQDKVFLAELSRNAPGGEQIWVTCKRIAPQQLVAGDFMPTRARMLINKFISLGVESTEAERNRVGLKGGLTMADINVPDLLEDTFPDDKIAQGDAYVGLVNAVCIAAVRDSEMHLYWKRSDAEADIYGFYIDDIPWSDRDAIATWALTQEDTAAQSVVPFPAGAATGASDVQPVESGPRATVRADQV